MHIRYDRPVSRSAFLARRLALFSLGLLLIVVLAHRFGPLSTPEFVLLVLASALPAALAVPLALLGLARLWQIGALGGVASAWALIYAALPLALPGYGYYLYVTKPKLTEVSTDLADRPAFVSLPNVPQHLLPRPDLPANSGEAQLAAYPGLNGRRYEGAIDRVYEAVRKVATENRLVVTASRGEEYGLPALELRPTTESPVEAEAEGTAPATQDALPESGPLPTARPEPSLLVPLSDGEPEGTARLQFATRTPVLGLPFDAVVRLREEAEMTLVDIRVASRYGPHDLGISDRIAEGFLHALDAELLGIAGN
ncbi:MAG: DUF1499 domain-containing protein [Agrobacterium albertimagni]|uniref:DUF1499 domain-containing protein n=1 Tax=Agrobacterium albertimagni AOL15 TaxID=1156935 RepID=K2P9P6_9HYPH|nr:DUF1499 domain-containing protein [Agrobacterium albertimagni]EKF57623.1 hypothetical protein QWE_20663 [Agrobacterium albertimagni AOL15]